MHGHLAAQLDPLGSEPSGDPALEPERLEPRLTPELQAEVPARVLRVHVPGETLADALPYLRETYCGTMAYEIEHISSHEERVWLRTAIESGRYRAPFSPDEQRTLLRRLTEVEGMETYLRRAFLGQKQFSIEGLDAMVPMEGALLAVPAAVLAPWVAVLGLRALNHVGPLAQIGLRLDPHVTATAYVLAVLAAILCVAALALPALRSGAVTSTVAGRGRPRPKSFVQRAGLDLVLVAVALVAYWQLRRYGGPVVESVQGRLGIDPLLIAAPALGLLAGAVLALRVVPAAASLVERLASSARGMSLSRSLRMGER